MIERFFYHFLIFETVTKEEVIIQVGISLLDCADSRLGKEKTQTRFSKDTDYIPSSARFKFKLICSKELSDDPRFTALSDDCVHGVNNLQKLLSSRVHDVLQLEITYAKETHLTTFISSFHIFAQGLTIRHLERNKKLNINVSIYNISLIALKKYMHDDITNLSNYFNMDKHTIFKHLHQLSDSSQELPPNSTNTYPTPDQIRQYHSTGINSKTTNNVTPSTTKHHTSPVSTNNQKRNLTTSTNGNDTTTKKPTNINSDANEPTIMVPSSGSEPESDSESLIEIEKENSSYEIEPTQQEDSYHIDTRLTEEIQFSYNENSQFTNNTNDNLGYDDISTDSIYSNTLEKKRLFDQSSLYIKNKKSKKVRDPLEQLLSDVNKHRKKRDNNKTKNNNDESASSTNSVDSKKSKKKYTTKTSLNEIAIPKKKRKHQQHLHQKTHNHTTTHDDTPPSPINLITPKTTKKHNRKDEQNVNPNDQRKNTNTSSLSTSPSNKKTNTNNTSDTDQTKPNQQHTNTDDTQQTNLNASSIQPSSSTHTGCPNPAPSNDKTTTINEITSQLHHIIPSLSYDLFNFHVAENQDSQADAAVLAFWETNDATTITTNVNLALEQEKQINKETISSLITKTCKHEISKSYNHRNANHQVHHNTHRPTTVRFHPSTSKNKHNRPSPPHDNPDSHTSTYHNSQPSTYHNSQPSTNFNSSRTNLISLPRPTKRLKWTPPQHHTPQQTVATSRHNNLKKIKHHNKRMQRMSSKLVAKNYQTYHHNKNT